LSSISLNRFGVIASVYIFFTFNIDKLIQISIIHILNYVVYRYIIKKRIEYSLGEVPIQIYAAARKHREMPMGQQVLPK
jgi:hypothetical protein